MTLPGIKDRLECKTMVDPNSGCWLWYGAHNGQGYGRIWYNGSLKYTHRVSFELERGPIPDGLFLDHKCRTPSCINPFHLEPVTNQENAQRGNAGHHNSSRTVCVSGHSFSENGYIDSRNYRQCRLCTRRRQSEYYQRKKANV